MNDNHTFLNNLMADLDEHATMPIRLSQQSLSQRSLSQPSTNRPQSPPQPALPASTLAAAQLADDLGPGAHQRHDSNTSTLFSAVPSHASHASSASTDGTARSLARSPGTDRLSAAIRRVLDDPGLIAQQEARVAVNHMMVFVFAHKILTDAFSTTGGGGVADAGVRQRVHEQKSKVVVQALDFFELTVNEMPEVLLHTTTQWTPAVLTALDGPASEDELRIRGGTPLWLWLAPRVLRLLGLPAAGGVVDEGIIRFYGLVSSLAVQSSMVWEVVVAMRAYLMQVVNGMSGCCCCCCCYCCCCCGSCCGVKAVM